MQQINDKKLNRILAQYVTSSSYAAAGLFPVPVLQKPKKKKKKTKPKKKIFDFPKNEDRYFISVDTLVSIIDAILGCDLTVLNLVECNVLGVGIESESKRMWISSHTLQLSDRSCERQVDRWSFHFINSVPCSVASHCFNRMHFHPDFLFSLTHAIAVWWSIFFWN